MKYKYVAAVVWYYPTQEQIGMTYRLQKMFSHIYVFDNTPDISNYNIIKCCNVSYISHKKNVGLAKAYNEIIDLLSEKTIVCILDQDSKILEKTINQIKDYIEYNDMQSVAIVAPHLSIHNKFPTKINETRNIEWTINSGSFLNVDLIKKYNMRYDEHYFLDCVDLDFCMQISRNGLKIIQVENCLLEQELGEKNKKGYGEHSALRHYYIARDRIYYNYKFFGRIIATLRSILQTIKHIMIICVCESNTCEKLNAIWKGMKDSSIE